MAGDVARVIALGASNLTRGFQTVVSTTRAAWGPDVEVVAALGHGRSYGAYSRFAVRTLPGILQSGLWQRLESSPSVPTRALVTDVGNDILYGFSPTQTLEWTGEAVRRLEQFTQDIVLTDLPVHAIRRLSEAKFLFLRSVLVPSCRRSLRDVQQAAERVSDGLATLAADRGITFFRLNPAWYGYDPIHIRPSQWRPAWQEILGSPPEARRNRGARLEAVRLYFTPPERQWLFGLERCTPQAGLKLPSGPRVRLY
jgi:hypothetical protein